MAGRTCIGASGWRYPAWKQSFYLSHLPRLDHHWPGVRAAFYGHTRTYISSYGNKELKIWAKRIDSRRAQGRDVHVRCDDTDGGAPQRAGAS